MTSAFLGCSSDRLKVDVSQVDLNLNLKHFETALFEADTSNWEDYFADLVNDYPVFFEETKEAELLRLRLQDPALQDLYKQVKESNALEKFDYNGLTDLLKHYAYYYPNRTFRTVYTYVSGMDMDYPVIFADTMIFVASDLYMGSSNEMYAGIPAYIVHGFQAKYLLKDIAKEMARYHIPNDPADKTLLNRMIYEGKRMYFTDAMMPEMDDSVKMGYASHHMEWVEDNEAYIWAYLINNKLLFNTEQATQSRFIEPAPFTKFYADVDQYTPGRVGSWLGWQIVRSYMDEHPEMSLQELLSKTNAQEILNESNYKPKK